MPPGDDNTPRPRLVNNRQDAVHGAQEWRRAVARVGCTLELGTHWPRHLLWGRRSLLPTGELPVAAKLEAAP